MDDAAARTTVDWREWGDAAFEEAERVDRPVLLAITGFWCGWCRAMDGRTYADPRIAARIADAVIPVRVDADRQPMVRARYTMGGLPATVFTTPEGRILASAGYLEPEDFRDVIDRVVDSWTGGDGAGDRPPGRVPEPLADAAPPGGSVTGTIVQQLIGQLDALFDERHAGWGTDPKFPLPATIEFALTRRPEQATRTLAAIREHLEDPGDGGFFRHARERDWSEPMLEKLLSVNAGLLRAHAQAYLATGDTAHRLAGERTVGFLAETLQSGGGFANSQAPGEYFSRPPADRRAADRPPVDQARYADTTAQAVEASLRFAAYTDDERARTIATEGLSWLLETGVRDGSVVHVPEAAEPSESGDPAARYLLGDQAAVLDALTTASQVLGPEYLASARSVADVTLDRLQTDSGAFRDGDVDGPALLDRPLFQIELNARLADALVDLAILTRDEQYRVAAERAVGAFADAAEHLGVQAARYGRAAARLVTDPLVIDVATDPGTDLHRAALRMADPEKVVVPGADIDSPGLAGIRGVDDPDGPIETPADLAVAVETRL